MWVFRYFVPAMLIASWLVVAGYSTRRDMPIERCQGPTGYCGKSGAPKTATDYKNAQSVTGIILLVWLIAGIGFPASRVAAYWIDSIPTAEERAAKDLRT